MPKKQLSKVKTPDGIPLAIVKGGDNDNQIIYFCDDLKNQELKIDDLFDHVKEKKIRKEKKYMSFREMMIIRNAFEYGDAIDDDDLQQIYEKIEPEVKENVKNRITICDGILRPLPHITDSSEDAKDQNDRIFISGASGSGKTTWIRRYVKKYHKLYPNNRVFLFAGKPKDKKLDDLDYIKRVLLDDTIYKTKLDLDAFRDSVVIFDDTDAIYDPKMCEAVRRIRNNLLENARSYGTSVIAVSHTLCNFNKTMPLHNECNKFVLFPRMGSHQVERFLKVYASQSPENVKKIMATPSLWIVLNKSTYPYTVISEHDIFIL